MRVLFCKLHCPSFICFCKQSHHIYTPGPLKLDNTPHVPSTVVSPSEQQSEEATEVKEEILDEKQQEEDEDFPKNKSSLKKVTPEEQEVQKKKVQWMDFLGKELVEIREFESSETELLDYESEYNKSRVCAIL